MDYVVQVLALLASLGGIGLAVGLGYVVVKELYRGRTSAVDGQRAGSLEARVNEISLKLDALEERLEFTERLLSTHPRSHM